MWLSLFMRPGNAQWQERRAPLALGLIASLAAVKLAIHLYYGNRYEFMSDELYVMDAAVRHLELGIIDSGPLMIWLSRLSWEMLGDTVLGLRFFNSLAGVLLVALTGVLTWELGGGRYAQGLACLAVLIAPGWLLSSNIVNSIGYESLCWTSAVFCLIRLIRTGDERWWLGVGVAAGIGLVNKPTMVLFGFSLVVSLLLTPHRRQFASKWLWIAGFLSLAIASPSFVWQVQHGLPSVPAARARFGVTVPGGVLAAQVYSIHPLNAVIWSLGIFYLATRESHTPHRLLAWMFGMALLIVLLAKFKFFYLSGVFPSLLAAGAIVVERALSAFNMERGRKTVPLLLAAGGIVTAPTGLPVLPAGQIGAYADVLSGATGLRIPANMLNALRDQCGWKEQVRAVAGVFDKLSPEERARCVILVKGYGEAGAVNYYGRAYGLPFATCPRQSFYFWSQPIPQADLAIVYGFDLDTMQRLYARVERVAFLSNPSGPPWRQTCTIYLCRNPKLPLREAWASLADFS